VIIFNKSDVYANAMKMNDDANHELDKIEKIILNDLQVR